MINLLFDTATQTVKLATAAVVKIGADVPVTITFSAAPGEVSSLSLALGTDATTPAVLAFTDDFAAENDTVRTALLDASDTRLVTFMASKGNTVVKLEVIAVIDGQSVVTPNVDVTVQKAIVTGPESSEGGPSYYTEAEVDALIAALSTGGTIWRNGAGVPNNATGVDGDYYLRTSNGDVYKRTAGTYAVVANLAGPVGANGASGTSGATWRSGSGAPSNGTGADGDFYLRTSNGDVYKRAAGVYSVVANLTGPAGEDGEDGGSGGTALIRGSGVLTGYTTPASTLVVNLNGAPAARVTGHISGISGGVTFDFPFYIDVDGSAGGEGTQVDVSGNVGNNNFAMESLGNAFNAAGLGVTGTLITESFTTRFEIPATAALDEFSAEVDVPGTYVFNGVMALEAGPSGNVDEVTLVPLAGSKTTKLVRARLTGNLPSQVQLAFKSGETYVACSNVLTPGGGWQEFFPDDNGGNGTPSTWQVGVAEYDLVARIVTAAGAQSGATCRIEVEAEQTA